MAKTFLTQADDEQFKQWMAEHPNGFYLNETQVGNIKHGQGGVILHKVSCHHLGNGEGIISTTYAKVADEDREALVSWAHTSDKNLTVVNCSSCKPE